MKPRRLFLTCSALLLAGAAPAFPQEPGEGAAITGTWTGDMGPPGAASRQPITVVLRLEDGALTGTVTGPPRPGTVRTGSFDPNTGRLRFEVIVPDGAGAPFIFDGMVVTGTALGRVTGNGITGDFRIEKDAASEAGGQRSGEGSANAVLRFGFGQVNEWVVTAAALVPADRWDFRPAPTVRTFGQQVAHIADSFAYYCGRASGQDVRWSDAVEKGTIDKPTVTQALERALAACTAVYDAGGDTGSLMANVAHTNLHYGNMITYLRMLGLVPPSS
jgi:uncharacterized damage-inducible protein DinB